METVSTADHKKIEDTPFRPRRLGHANIFVSNYEKAFEFYNAVAGFEEVYRQPDNKASFVSNGNTYHDYGLTDIHSRYAKPGQKPGLFHFAFELKNEADLVDGYRQAVKTGVEIQSTEDHDVAHSLYKFDPDGNAVEYYADVVPDWRSARRGIIIKSKPKYVPGETSQPLSDEFYPKDPEIRVVKNALFHSKKVAHVALMTKDYEGMHDYYTGFAGLVPFIGGRNSDFVVLRGTHASQDLTLYRNLEGTEPGLHHIGMEVWDESNLNEAVHQLQERKIALVADVNHSARHAVTILDPDNIRLQFFVNRKWEPTELEGLDFSTALKLL